jgi:hypothetical protein|tara:strand:+ start:2782 stop:3126 length:345 start_codon:yes stop_codon:yes gene_type:complete
MAGLRTLFDSDGDNSAQACKTSNGRLYGVEVSNPNSADAYLQLFDLATGSVTVGTTTPKLSFLVPAGNGTIDGAYDDYWTDGIEFNVAITYACTTGVATSGDPTTGLIVNMMYR